MRLTEAEGVKLFDGDPIVDRADGAGRDTRAVTNFRLRADRQLDGINPMSVANGERRRKQIARMSDDHLTALDIGTDHIKRLGRGDPQALALTDRIKCGAFVSTENFSI